MDQDQAEQADQENTPGPIRPRKINQRPRVAASQQFILRQSESQDQNAENPIVVEVIPETTGMTKQAASLDARPNQGSRLDRLITDGLVDNAVRALREALTAVKTIGRGDNAKSEPDWICRIKAAELILAYGEGEPIKRQQVTQVTHTTLQEFQQQIAGAPAAQSAMAELIEMMKAAAAVQKNPENSSGQKGAENAVQ